MDLPMPTCAQTRTPTAVEDQDACGLCRYWQCRCTSGRRPVAVGIIRRVAGRTVRLTATEAGITGSIRPTAGACPACGGTGGRTEDTSDGGIRRQTWRTCQTCRGTGAA